MDLDIIPSNDMVKLVKNPYLSYCNINLKQDELNEFYFKNKKLFIISLPDNINHIQDKIYANYITIQDYEDIKSKIIVKQVSVLLLKNLQFMNLLIYLNISDLPQLFINLDNITEYFNNKSITESNILCISAINITSIALNSYIQLYDGLCTFNNYIYYYLLNDYMGKYDSEIMKKNRYALLNNMKETMYWESTYNCNLNITLGFYNRGFNLSLYQKLDKNIRKLLEKMNDKTNDNIDYLSMITKKQTYIDASFNNRYNKYSLYKIMESDSITKSELNIIFIKINKKREKYLLLCNLLITKEYCHLIINNKNILSYLQTQDDQGKTLLREYTPIFSYLISYAWLVLYTEESIKKTYTKQTDRYVFDIETASKLPYFPCIQSDPQTSPYLSLLVSKEILQGKENNLGVYHYYFPNIKYGVCDMATLQTRLNIFITGKSHIDIFKNINWTNIAISGSVIAACLPNVNPLMMNFMENNGEFDFNKYCDEYYNNSDIDVICNIESCFDYIKHIYDLKTQINKNIIEYNKLEEKVYINIEPFKTAVVFVNKQFITQYILPKTNMTLFDILLNIHETHVKQLFYEWYLKQKLLDNNIYKNTSQFKEPIYDIYFDVCSVDNLMIAFTDHLDKNDNTTTTKQKSTISSNTEYDKIIEHIKQVYEKSEINNNIEIDNNDKYENDIDQINIKNDKTIFTFVIKENIKFKITSNYLKRRLEVFKSKYDFFATVSRFHLPIVRAYITNNNVYILPSCITACMTMMNIDYKYFAGSKDPIEIINKYRSRGFGTYLNNNEKAKMIEYSNMILKWKELYKLNLNNQTAYNNFFGNIEYNAKLFRPLNSNYTIINNNEYIQITEQNINEIYKKIYGGKYDKISGVQNKIFKRTCINEYGFVSPIRKWLIMGCYEDPIKSG